MDGTLVAGVRRFNRTVTQRVGALDDAYLSRGRPLGQARLLWEIGAIGPQGDEVRSLRARLELDSGYLSRMLRALEADGLVVVDADGADGRVRRARLTPAGRRRRRRGEAHVGVGGRSRSGAGPAAARRAGDPGRGPRRPRAPAGNQPRPHRGDRALPGGRVPRGRSLQRRALRPPLVREDARRARAGGDKPTWSCVRRRRCSLGPRKPWTRCWPGPRPRGRRAQVGEVLARRYRDDVGPYR